MKLTLKILIFFISIQSFSQDIFGKWTVIDKHGVSKCIVSIYKENDKVVGEIVEILIEENKNAICTKCEDKDNGKPILGLKIIQNMEKDGNYYKNGTIFDPENGEKYSCRLALEDDNTLQVRGYLAFLYSTQYWKRVK